MSGSTFRTPALQYFVLATIWADSLRFSAWRLGARALCCSASARSAISSPSASVGGRSGRATSQYPRRAFQRQRAEVHAGHAWALERPGQLPGAAALRHACAVGGRAAVGPAAPAGARADGGARHRRYGPAEARAASRSRSNVQHGGALGKTGNCQVAVSSLLLGAALVGPLSCELYVPRESIDDGPRRAKAGVPDRLRLPARNGVSRWRTSGRCARRVSRMTRRRGRCRLRHDDRLSAGAGAARAALCDGPALGCESPVRRRPARGGPDGRGHPVAPVATGGLGTRHQGPPGGPLCRLAGGRLTGTPGERWLLCERSHDPPTSARSTCSSWPRCRVAPRLWCAWRGVYGRFEQQVPGAQGRLGLGSFRRALVPRAGRIHTVLTALAFTFLQLERLRSPDLPRPTLPTVRLWVREIMAVLYITSTPRLMNLLRQLPSGIHP